MGDEVEEMPAEDAGFEEIDEDNIRVEPRKPSRAPLVLSLVALIVAALALAGVGFVGRSVLQTAEPVVQDTAATDALADAVAATEKSLDEVSRSLSEIADRESAAARQMEQYRREFERRLEIVESLPDRIDNVENTMSSIQGISTGVRDTWLLAEAEYYMQIANAQLQLAGNPHLARLALLQADERIQQLANPALTKVRRTLSDELRALETMTRPDIEGITLTLASLAGVVDALPLQQELDIPAADIAEPDSELSGLDRAMASFKSTVADVVSVRRTDENIRPLIAPESAYFLRANLSLQLQAARLALLRGEKSAFQQSLDDASAWLDEYYDGDSAQVQSAKLTISEIRDSLFDISAPDISESLRLLRQFSALAAASAEDSNAGPAAEGQPEQ